MELALVFPGQGSQSVGMLGELAASRQEVAACFEEASDALGTDLWTLVQQGPREELDRTERTQPAMLAAGVATWRVWQAMGGPDPRAMAGHSLGEYSALVAAGAIGFADAVRLVEFRGQAMQEAVPAGEGAMAAIIGLDDAEVRSCCSSAAQGDVVEAVNHNAPGQVVIAGSSAAVERAIEACKEAGAKRALPLPVSAPSHCALMRPAAERLAERLADIEIAAPSIPVVHNYDVTEHPDPDEIRIALRAQLHSPVRWVETVEHLRDAGAGTIHECGPGKVLAGLNRRIDRGIVSSALLDEASIAAAIEAIGG